MLKGQLVEARLDFEKCLNLDRSLESLVAGRIKLISRQLEAKR